jgi:hypothetical protein
MASNGNKRQITPKGAKLPGRTLADALSIAKVLSDLAAPSSKDRIAGENNETSAGGNFKTKFAAAGYFGLVEKDGDKYKLTERGRAAIGGDVQAKRAAVMGTGFGPVIKLFSTRKVKDSVIEARLKDDCNASESSVENLREVLVESATEAGLVVDGKFDATAIESVADDEIGPKPGPRSRKSPDQTSKAPRPPAKDPPPEKDPPPPKEPPAAVNSPIQVVVQVDGSKMEPAKLAELIRLLGKTQ